MRVSTVKFVNGNGMTSIVTSNSQWKFTGNEHLSM